MFGLATMVAALVAVGGLNACEITPDTYVSLGDSYTAGPLILDQSTDPLGCLRSTNDWPRKVAPTIRAAKFKDVSCSGAQTGDMFAPQNVTPGPANPAQTSSVDAFSKVVTLQIGGNDIGFTDIVKTCATQNPFGDGCTGDYVHDGRDELSEKINATAPKVAAVLAEIKRRSPNAKTFVVGYPTVIPETGNGCYPLVPVLAKDIPYLRSKVKELNSMLQSRAVAAGATYIDIATPSIGHDFCQSVSNKWVEGIIPTAVAAPVHPNAKGMAAFATVISAAINAKVTN